MTGAWERLGRIALLVSAAAASGATVAAQQTPPDPTPAPQGEAASNVTPYKPAFFTQFRPNTALDMIGRIPGFSFDGGSDARGFSGTGGNVLIDGERSPSRGDSLSSIISRIPANGVERIDVIRGGADGIDMQGKPVVANIIRKKDVGVTGSLSANVNVNAFGGISPNATLALRNQAGADLLDGSIGLFHNTGNPTSRRWRVTPAGAVDFVGFSGSYQTFDSLQMTGAWESLVLGGKLRINGKANLEQFEGKTVETLFHRDGEQVTDDLNHNQSGEAGLRYARTISGADVELVGFQSYRTDDSTNSFDTPTRNSDSIGDGESGESIARATVRIAPASQWTVDGGVEGVFNFSESTGARSVNGAPFLLNGDANRVEESRGELFGTATWAPASGLSIEVGLRNEWSTISARNEGGASELSLQYLKPRLNVSWSPAAGHQWGFQIEQDVDQLDFGVFSSTASFDNGVNSEGSLDIEPQKNLTVDLRYERQFGGQNSIVVHYGHQLIDGFLTRSISTNPLAAPGTEVTDNAGTATRDALEFDSSFELDRFGMQGGIFVLGADLRTSHIVDPVTGEDRRVNNTEPWSWNASLQQTLDNGNFRWGVFIEDDGDFRTWQPRSVTYNHSGTFLGANVTWKPGANWTLGGGVNGIIAEDNTNYQYFYTAPRNSGTIQYRQDQTFEARRQFFVNARMNF